MHRRTVIFVHTSERSYLHPLRNPLHDLSAHHVLCTCCPSRLYQFSLLGRMSSSCVHADLGWSIRARYDLAISSGLSDCRSVFMPRGQHLQGTCLVRVDDVLLGLGRLDLPIDDNMADVDIFRPKLPRQTLA